MNVLNRGNREWKMSYTDHWCYLQLSLKTDGEPHVKIMGRRSCKYMIWTGKTIFSSWYKKRIKSLLLKSTILCPLGCHLLPLFLHPNYVERCFISTFLECICLLNRSKRHCIKTTDDIGNRWCYGRLKNNVWYMLPIVLSFLKLSNNWKSINWFAAFKRNTFHLQKIWELENYKNKSCHLFPRHFRFHA